MIKIIEKDFERLCTGCGACKSACPTDAIRLEPNHEGFLMPVIDEDKCIGCHKCEKTCPALNVNKTNQMPDKMYAVRAADEIRSVSSSGGVFTLVAEAVLDAGGYVAGAAFDENMRLHHVVIDDKEQLSLLRGSKYLQSDTELIYRELGELLKTGKPVFFTGTPCQVAGLNNYLGKRYENLYTMDILCHGVPSQQIFDKFLEENSNGKKAESVNFRNKSFGWSCETTQIKFCDGTEYVKSMRDGNEFVRAFLGNMDLRHSCANCPFSELPRHGDISVGDFWGIDNIDASQNDRKGTSMLLVNNAKGMRMLDKFIAPHAVLKKYDFRSDLPNRIHAIQPSSAKRERFFSLIKHHTLEQSIDYVLNGKYDVGLVSNYLAWNFGGALTQYALYHALEDLGYSTLMIERPASAPEKRIPNTRTKLFSKWLYPEYAESKEYPTREAMRELNNICDAFVTGSDVLFRTSLFKKMDGIVALDWVSDNKKKIAYSASNGFEHLENFEVDKDNPRMAHFLQKFDAFSTREDSGVNFFKDNFGVDATQVLDPVFICDPGHFDSVIANSKRTTKDDYIGAYILDPAADKRDILRLVSEKLDKPVEVFSEYGDYSEGSPVRRFFGEFDLINLNFEERLQSLKNAKFLVLDSFHGTCFAIIFNIPFICYVNERRGATRFKSILKVFGLEDRMVRSLDEVAARPELLESPDFDKVNSILASERERCLKWLDDALKKEKSPAFSTYDVIMNELAKREEEIDFLKRKIDFLMAEKCALPFIDETEPYLDALEKIREDYSVIISVRDTPGIELTREFAERLKRVFGTKINISGNHQKSYAAVVRGNKVIFEKLQDGPLQADLKLFKKNVKITSAGLHHGNASTILINGVDYSLNKRGLNIVIVENSTGNVVDKTSIDTHLKPFKMYR